MTKSELNQKIEMLTFCINDSHGAVSVDEKLLASVRIESRMDDLMIALKSDLNAHAKKLVEKANEVIARARHYIHNLELAGV